MPKYRYQQQGDMTANEIEGSLEVDEEDGAVAVAESQPRIVFLPATLEVQLDDGTWSSLGDAFRDATGASDTQVLAVARGYRENLIDIATNAFHSWRVPPGEPPLVHFRSREGKTYNGNASDVIGVRFNIENVVREAVRADQPIPRWVSDQQCRAFRAQLVARLRTGILEPIAFDQGAGGGRTRKGAACSALTPTLTRAYRASTRSHAQVIAAAGRRW